MLRQPPDDERWTVVSSIADGSADLADESHRRRWHDYLQWANVLQFLRRNGRDAVICASSMGTEALDDLWIVDIPVGPQSAAGHEPSATMIEELELVEDNATRALVEEVLRAGASEFIAGLELDDGQLVEAGWPAQRVGVARSGQPVPSDPGWSIRTVSEWDSKALLEALGA